MKKIAFIFFLAVFAATNSWSKDNVEKAGDALQLIVPAVAFALTFYEDDPDGRIQFYKSAATTFAVTHTLKQLVDAKRPNGKEHSFPSGHTSAAFQGAAFIHSRYGLESALPAYAAAAFVGYSRIDSKNHYFRDVLAGAAIGVGSSFYFSPERFGKKQALLVPYYEKRQFGIIWSRPLD